MKTLLLSCLLTLGALPAFAGPTTEARATAPAVTPGEWTENYAAALTQAKSEHRKIVLLFTGSDWCSWCKKLDREILSTPEFKAFAAENLLLVKLDFPRHTPQAEQLRKQNRQLADKHAIEMYPTLIVLNSSGKPVGKLGYLEGGPGGFVQKIKSF